MTKLTPMMAQYKKIKAEHEDCILMFRLGDFYEMFFDDAVEAAKILQITLTARGKAEGVSKIPMCGIPFHALDQYLYKLTKAGKKVAIADQITQPDGKGIVEREVIKIVTPGTTFNENILDNKSNNYVACVVAGKNIFGFAYSDVTTGEFKVSEFENEAELRNEIKKIGAIECICEEKMSILNGLNLCVFEYQYYGDATQDICKNFDIKSLESFGLEGKLCATKAAAMLLNYLKETQKTELKHIQKISYLNNSKYMPVSETMLRNLEIFYTAKDSKKEGSLAWAIDNTVTSMGGRLLRNWMVTPLIDQAAIEKRLDGVEMFVKNSSLLRNVRDILSSFYDIERLLSRLSLGSGNARDLLAMKMSLELVPKLKELFEDENLIVFEGLTSLIGRAIAEEPPVGLRDGGMIADGYNKELDELRALSRDGKSYIKDLQEREVKRSGISSLKVKFNKVFGYYIEISNSNLANVPADYIRKQTLVNAERFITPELKEYEEKVLSAEDKISELEYQLFYEVRMEVIKKIVEIQKTARAVAKVDVLSCFAFNAEKKNYCRPHFGEITEIKDGRHAVAELLVNDFVPNDCIFNNEKNFVLITGPNMGGKSTYLRQVALISFLAQIGSYVPASKADLKLVDRIFTRVGASDNLSKGDSTFMVEMQEAAYILNQATEKSLIILDEIGRGTSTYDGLSIAWAMSEFLHDKIKANTLFATHYHELLELTEGMERGVNLSVAVRENEKEGVVFLYKIVAGGVDKSYGIEVAKLAGLPMEVVGRARGVMRELESKHIKKATTEQVEMFESEETRSHRKVVEKLREVDVDNLTPLEALQKLHEIKKSV
ncbi:DNA mismatch repair protein MutS [Candidatus Peregrinibacteria bacterium CG10_big_fil_rev_8_21_14_0_10_36_19]|nr:MAG: DNA mismatch repair protein MutS [Candidatus Peregrinibacteria bacterium CG10_big_fil_rev_8_21_14_0_10_36_19]